MHAQQRFRSACASDSSLVANLVSQGWNIYYADNEDSDQTAWMRRLIRLHLAHICQGVRFLMWRLISLGLVLKYLPARWRITMPCVCACVVQFKICGGLTTHCTRNTECAKILNEIRIWPGTIVHWKEREYGFYSSRYMYLHNNGYRQRH